MARSRSRAGRTTSSRQTRATSRKKAAPATTDVEVVEEEDGVGTEGGLAIITAVLLVAACLFLDFHLGERYDAGVFF